MFIDSMKPMCKVHQFTMSHWGDILKLGNNNKCAAIVARNRDVLLCKHTVQNQSLYSEFKLNKVKKKRTTANSIDMTAHKFNIDYFEAANIYIVNFI